MNDAVDRLRNHLQSELGDTWTTTFGEQSEKEIIRNYEALWRGLLLELAGSAAAEAQVGVEKFSRMLTFRGVLNSSIVNASAEWNKDRQSYMITMNGALSRLIYQVVKLISTRVGVMGIDGHKPVSPRNTLESAIGEVRLLMDAFFDGRIMATHGYPLLELQRHQLQFIGRFSRDVDRFVLAHELGHIILMATRRQHSAYETMADLCRQVAMDTNVVVADSWAEELAADNIGLHLTLQTRENGMDRAAAFSSAELFCLIVGLLDRFFFVRHRSHPPLGTHPPGKIRLQILRNAAQGSPSTLFEMGKGFEMIIDNMAQAL